MTEIRRDDSKAFWDIVDFNDLENMSFDTLGVEEASHDSDITALCELRVLLETDAVSPQRAELIERMIDDQNEESYRQLIYEVQTKFQLCDTDMDRALKLAEQRAISRKYEDIEWMEP